MRPGFRNRPGAPHRRRLQLAIGTADRALNDRERQNSFALARFPDIMPGRAEIAGQ